MFRSFFTSIYFFRSDLFMIEDHRWEFTHLHDSRWFSYFYLLLGGILQKEATGGSRLFIVTRGTIQSDALALKDRDAGIAVY